MKDAVRLSAGKLLVGRSVHSEAEAVAAGVNVAVRLMALCLAALMALLGAFVAVRR